jgi:hypothetical protein
LQEALADRMHDSMHGISSYNVAHLQGWRYKMAGRQIRIYLVDGTPNGIRTAEIINWTGSILVVPRARLPEVAHRREAIRTGVYCLVGPDAEFSNRDKVYVGEGDNVFTRLVAHSNDPAKDFWTTAVICVSKDENLTKSHGRYLESRLIALAETAGRASVVNGTSPAGNPLPEADLSDMEYFLEQVQVVFPVLGLTFLQPVPTAAEERIVFENNDVGAHARAIESDGEFVVLKGSTARKDGSPSWSSYKELREELIQAGKLRQSPNAEFLEFTVDVPFRSPSAAAAVVAGGNRNGRVLWRVEGDGRTYAEWQEARLVEAGVNLPIEQ